MYRTILLVLTVVLCSCNQQKDLKNQANQKPTICILGGIPSTKDILKVVPDSIKNSYNFISFDRPGFGGTENSPLTKEQLIDLAKKAGIEQNDFGIIGISAGAPMAILLASEFKLKHCGVIGGMVTRDAYFKYADSTVTKQIMDLALSPYPQFEQAMSGFPNIEAFVDEAQAKDKQTAIRAFYDELNFIVSEELSMALVDKSIGIDWWHGESDRNITLESARDFLSDYKNAKLNIVPEAGHNLEIDQYIVEIVQDWE